MVDTGTAVDRFRNLVAAINEGSISDVEHWLPLCDGVQTRKVDGGQLTIVGHVVVSRSDPEVLEILLRRADITVNFEEQSSADESAERIPLLHLAAYVGNLEAVTLLCKSQDLNFNATLSTTHLTALHISVKGGNPGIVRHVLHRAHQCLHLDNPGNPDRFPSFLNAKDILGLTALHYAAWEGQEDIVAHLLEYKDAMDVNSKTDHGITALLLASRNNRLGVVKRLLANPQIDPQVPCDKLDLIMGDLTDRWLTSLQQSMQDLENFLPQSSDRRFRDTFVRGHIPCPVHTFRLEQLKGKEATEMLPFHFADLHNDGITALHCAAFAGHSEIVGSLVRAISAKAQARKTLNAVDDHLMTPLHYAVIGGDALTVEELSTNSMVRGNHEEMDRNLTPLEMAYALLRHAKDPKLVQEYKIIVSVLLQRHDIQRYMEDLYKEKQVFMNAVNAMLVGAALITSITFQAWLTIPSLDHRRHWYVMMYWIFTVYSFLASISSVMMALGAVLPSQAVTRKAELQRIRWLFILVSMTFNSSLVSLLTAFMILPQHPEYHGLEVVVPTWIISLVGFVVCLSGIYFYWRELYRFNFVQCASDMDNAMNKQHASWKKSWLHGITPRMHW